jgi:hypothetical protein
MVPSRRGGVLERLLSLRRAAVRSGGDTSTPQAGGVSPAEPLDPFAGDPDDPARQLDALDDDVPPPVSPADREQVLGDLEDLELFETLLRPRGVQGLAVPCADCGTDHHVSWDLLRANLRQLLDSGTTRVHEPALSADPSAYVSWDYARGFTDACLAADDGS